MLRSVLRTGVRSTHHGLFKPRTVINNSRRRIFNSSYDSDERLALGVAAFLTILKVGVKGGALIGAGCGFYGSCKENHNVPQAVRNTVKGTFIGAGVGTMSGVIAGAGTGITVAIPEVVIPFMALSSGVAALGGYVYKKQNPPNQKSKESEHQPALRPTM